MFDFALSSHQIGHVKPDVEAFAYLLAEAGALPQDLYFFDDLQPNVEAAKALGMNAIRVEGISALKVALKKEGLHEYI